MVPSLTVMASLKLSQYWVNYGLLILLILLLFFLTFGEWGLVHYWRLSEERRLLEQKTHAMQRNNELLREKIYRLRKDDRYLEKVAREELGLAKDGEIVYRFPSSGVKKSDGLKDLSSGSHRSSERSEHP